MKERQVKGFDRLAPIYDSLAQLIIGKGIRKSQLHFLDYLKEKNKLLILGGGTGWILPYIIDINPTLKIDYIELSPKMILKAEKSIRKNKNVRFIVGTEANIIHNDYDSVLTNFYLDLFKDSKLNDVVSKIKAAFLVNTVWITTDFVSEQSWHKVMLWIMYRFFNITTGLNTLSLPKWENSLIQANGKLVAMKKYSRGFIKTAVYHF